MQHNKSFVRHLFKPFFKKNKLIRILFLLLFINFSGVLFSQLDTLHYMPPLHFEDNTQIADHYIYVSTPSATPFTVTIEDGNGNVLASPMISNAATYIYTVGNGQISGSKTFVPTDSLNTVLTHSGLKLYGDFEFYANLRARASSQAESLTSKGTSAFGTEFRYGGFPQFTNGSVDRNFTAGIMATEDNTIITIDDYDPLVVFDGNPTFSSPSINITLNEGECYVVSGSNSISFNQDGFMGARIISDKPIVLSNGNLLGNIHPTSTSRDMGIDQSVPVNRVGKRYIVVEGDGIAQLEQPIIIAHYDNTDVYINGNPAIVTTLQAGDYYLVPNTYYQGINHRNMYIETSENVYLYQALSGSVSEANGGLNFIPPLNCFLPDTINYIPNVNNIGAVNFNGGVMLFTKQGATLQINGVTQGGAEAVPSVPWETYKIQSLTGNVTITCTHSLAAGIYGYNGAAGFAGFFAGFSSLPVNSDFQYIDTCLGMNTEFVGLIDSTTYIDSVVWDFGDPASGTLNYSLSANPLHSYSVAGTYTVQMIVYRCENDTIIHDITIQELPSIVGVSDQVFCAQSNTSIIPFSGSILGTNYHWINDTSAIGLGLNGVGEIAPFLSLNPDSIPLVANIIVTPEIAGCYGASDTFLITINPYPIAYVPNDTVLCANQNTNTYDFSSSVIGATYSWVNNNTTTGLSSNGNSSVTSFLTQNVTTNPIVSEISVTPIANGCSGDPVLFSITVNPLPYPDAGPDQVICLGDSILLSVIGADQYIWNDSIINNSFIQLSNLGINEFIVEASDLNNCQNTDTVLIDVVEPPVSSFTSDVTEGLTILTVSFSNTSLNSNSFEWDFDNGTSYSINDLSPQNSDFIDLGDYSVMLVASNGICTDTSVLLISVVPFTDPIVQFPNVFSPNNDASNDLFEIYNENIIDFELNIFNRWGNLIYFTTNVDAFWDGKVNGSLAKDGVYFYTYSAKGISEKEISGHGYFTLIH